MKIYHTTDEKNWTQFADKDFYEAPSLKTEGFIHASFAGQLEETLRVHFQGVSTVLILEIETDELSASLVVEKSRNGEDFPHIYGAINKNAVTNIERRDLMK